MLEHANAGNDNPTNPNHDSDLGSVRNFPHIVNL